MTLPPGQRSLAGFPRFDTRFRRPVPTIPAEPTIEIVGAAAARFSLPVARLADIGRREMVSDLHCVAGWSATGLRWEGVPFQAFYRELIAPSLRPDMPITHVVFGGLDGYQSTVSIDDALADDVLIADRLDGRPLDGDHGAPARIVSPRQYGYVSTKHLCRIELHTTEPPADYHDKALTQLALRLVKPHNRARVWHEERHRYLPARALRPVYRLLIPPIRWLNRRGQRRPPAR